MTRELACSMLSQLQADLTVDNLFLGLVVEEQCGHVLVEEEPDGHVL